MRISDWSSDVCSSDLFAGSGAIVCDSSILQPRFQVSGKADEHLCLGLHRVSIQHCDCHTEGDRISRRYHIRNISEIALDEVPDDSSTPKPATGPATTVHLCRRVRSAGPDGPEPTDK